MWCSLIINIYEERTFEYYSISKKCIKIFSFRTNMNIDFPLSFKQPVGIYYLLVI
jgi:hypothetical protein